MATQTSLSAAVARRIITKAVDSAFVIVPRDQFVFSRYFVPKYFDTLAVSYETTGLRKYIAEDVNRTSSGNINTFDKSAENIIVPPFFHERMDMVQSINGYFSIWGLSADDSEISEGVANMAKDSFETKMTVLRDRILRRIELYSSQIFNTGTVVTTNNGQYDFGRDAASIKDYSAGGLNQPWTTTTVNPDLHLAVGCEYVKNIGRVDGSQYFDVFVEESAWNAYVANPIIQAKANLRRMALIDITTPVKASNEATYLGETTVGIYKVRFWSHSGTYEDSSNNLQKYLPAGKVIILPSEYQADSYVQMHAGITDHEKGRLTIRSRSQFYLSDRIDEHEMAHWKSIKSCCLPVLKNKGAVYTIKAL